MKKSNLLYWIYQLASPLALIVLGAVLTLAPDLLSYLLAKFLGWAILAVGIGLAVAAIAGNRATAPKVLGAMAAFAVGGWLTRHPLSLASQVGLFLGIVLLIRGLRELTKTQQNGKFLGIATLILGVVLIFAPLTAARLVFSLCGVGMAIIGIVMAVDRLRRQPCLEDGDDPNIIDAL